MATQQPPQQAVFELRASRQFVPWLQEQGMSLVMTTQQHHNVLLVGITPQQELSLFTRRFPLNGAVCTQGNSIYLRTLFQIWRFENFVNPGERYEHFDALFVPSIAYTTGQIDAQDITVDSRGQLYFANTLFSCVATLSDTHSFKPLWQPEFIKALTPENRCFLSGLTLRDDTLRYVTVAKASDVANGWQENPNQSGLIIDTTTNKSIVKGLTLPFAPRWHEDKLWLLNAGTGELGFIEWSDKDQTEGTFKPITFCNGFPQGLAFYKQFALVAVSKAPKEDALKTLPLHTTLTEKKTTPKAGLLVIDTRSGDIVHSLLDETDKLQTFNGLAIMENYRCPSMVGLMTDEIRRIIAMDSSVLKPKQNAHAAMA